MIRYSIFLLTIFQMLGIALVAQPVISSSVIPTAGTTINNRVCNAGSFDPGSAGANVSWNFVSIDTTTTTYPFQYILPSATPNASSFPAATVALSQGGGNYTYYEVNSSAYINRGADGAYPLYYSVGEKLLSFPFTYNNSFTSNFSFDVQATFNRGGTTTVVADGFGTLALPGRTYTNVLRTKTIEVYRDSFYSAPLIDYYEDTLYNWYSPQTTGSLLTYYHFTVSGASVQDAQALYYSLNPATGIVNIARDADFSIYPNPTRDILAFNLNEVDVASAKVTITDMEGKVVRTYQNLAQQQSLDVSGLNTGIYLVSVNTPSTFLGTSKLNIIK